MTSEETLVSYQKAVIEKWANRDPKAMEEYLNFLHPEITVIGTGLHEIITNKEEFTELSKNGRAELSKTPTMEIEWLKGKVYGDVGYTWGVCHLKIPHENQFLEMLNWRFSTTWIKEVGKDWKMVHGHSSVPWVLQPEGKAFPIEELQARNQELEKMVAEKTADLVEKNRELEIEAAMERVRAASMTMQHSSQFIEVCKILRNQLDTLGLVAEFDSVEILLFDEELEISTTYLTQDLGPNQAWKFVVAIEELPEFRQMYNDWKAIPPARRKENFAIMEFQGDRFNALMEWVIIKRSRTAAEKEAFIEVGKQLKKDGWYIHYLFFRDGAISIGGNHQLSAPQLTILHRFAATFEQTYIRFLDLQKAENQAKEAQIEAALERVRAHTMAMHKSEELSKVTEAMFKEFQQFNLTNEFTRAAITIIEEDTGDSEMWMTRLGGAAISTRFEFNLADNALWETDFLAIKKIEPSKRKEHRNTLIYEGKDWEDVIAYAKEMHWATPAELRMFEEAGITQMIEHYVWFAYGHLGIQVDTPLSDDAFNILQRFAAVFEQTYTRFLDLQKAEAQAKKAQIEAALERVRAQTMAMHKSEELSQVATAMFKEFKQFNLTNEFTRAIINIIDEESGECETWMTALGGGEISTNFKYNALENEAYEAEFQSFKKVEKHKRKEHIYTTVFEREAFEELLEYCLEINIMPPSDVENLKEAGIQKWVENSVMYAYGTLVIARDSPLSEDAFNILQRFAAVFEQTYTRFLDLQKAEEQVRAVQIGAAVERVRAKALAMHNSTDILGVAVALRQEMVDLELPGISAATIYLKQDDGSIRMWDLTEMIESENGPILSMDVAFKLEDIDDRLWINEVWRSEESYFMTKMEESQYPLAADFLWQYMPAAAKPYEQFIKDTQLKESWHPVVPIVEGKGRLTVDFLSEPPAIIETILPQMGAAFDLAYTRFEDLQQAEQQTRQIAKIFEENQRLLHSILPEQIAEQIRKGEQTVVKRFEQVSILFADIVGFTILSEKLSPQKVVDILNGLFSKFDDLTDKYQLEKIKTIGDAYMVASGVPEEKTDHALMLFQFAQDMLRAIQDYNKMHQLELEIRIGICSGPVVAGVIGKKKFAYDLWGDTVNTAARMEAYGQASCIQLAPASYELLKDDYVFEKIPNVEIKGKGLMDVYVWN